MQRLFIPSKTDTSVGAVVFLATLTGRLLELNTPLTRTVPDDPPPPPPIS